MITVNKRDDNTFNVTVEDEGSSRTYSVTVDDGTWQILTNGKVAKEQLVEASFGFLLEREPKESIMSSFDLTIIGRYFPEYEQVMKKRYS